MTRRRILSSLVGGVAALAWPGTEEARAQVRRDRSGLGVVTYALSIHRRDQWGGRHAGLSPALALLEESRGLGAGGIQVELIGSDLPHLDDLRERAERYGMYVEAIVSLPEEKSDVDRFEQAVGQAKRAGALLARTVMMPGRRYERFTSLREFREYEVRGEKSLARAEPILARHKFRLAVENHKDQRTWEKLASLERISSEYLGVCVDVGNNFPLLEDPLATVRALAPWALTVHLKDQAVREYEEGYWLADVALGEGFLDLPAITAALRQAKPGIRFNLETITRDPIKVPLLTEGFWLTLQDTPARELARTLRVLKTQPHPEPFPLVAQLPPDQQLALEHHNIRRSLDYASRHLEL